MLTSPQTGNSKFQRLGFRFQHRWDEQRRCGRQFRPGFPLDTPREPLEEPEDLGNDSDTGSETSERISPDLHRNSDEGDREKQESTIIPSKLGADDALSASKKEEATSRMAATPPRGSPVLQETGGSLTTTTSESPGQKHNPTIIPPTIVTSDLTKGDPVTGSCRSVVNLQEVIDLRVVEAQRSGHLDLSNLGLPFFPSAVLLADGSMIHRVSLQDNQLVELTGSSLTQLTSVTWLDLRYNLLSDLPREVACLSRLQVLLLQGNRLTSLPASLGTLPELATLQVSDNPIIFPPPDVIKGGTRVILRFLKEKCAASENNESLTNPCTADEDHPGGNHKILASNARERSESWEEEEEEDSSFDNEENGGGVERCGSARTWYGWDGGSEGDTEDSESDQNSRRRQKRGSENESKDDEDEEKGDNPPSLSTNFRIAITKGVEEQHDLHLSLQQRPDSESDTLGRASSPASACLLTPNFDFPTRPEFDVTREDATCERGLGHDPRGPEDNTPGVTWSCDCVQDTSCISPDSRMRILNRLPDSKHRFLNSFSSPRADSLQSFLLPVGSIMVPSEALSHIEGHRRTIHLHLQGDPHQLEDDMESLEGDLGEGYRRPLSEALSHTDDDCQRQVNSISLPVVRLQLPSLEEQLLLQQQQQQLRGGTAAGSRRLWRTARRPLEGSRRSRPSLVSKRNQKEQHKPKLVTVAEVHRRAREERRRQRERLAAARELDANQRLKYVVRE
nr:uncharacterized protein LOC128692652 [Cherax quadricarinatus]